MLKKNIRSVAIFELIDLFRLLETITHVTKFLFSLLCLKIGNKSNMRLEVELKVLFFF